MTKPEHLPRKAGRERAADGLVTDGAWQPHVSTPSPFPAAVPSPPGPPWPPLPAQAISFRHRITTMQSVFPVSAEASRPSARMDAPIVLTTLAQLQGTMHHHRRASCLVPRASSPPAGAGLDPARSSVVGPSSRPWPGWERSCCRSGHRGGPLVLALAGERRPKESDDTMMRAGRDSRGAMREAHVRYPYRTRVRLYHA